MPLDIPMITNTLNRIMCSICMVESAAVVEIVVVLCAYVYYDTYFTYGY